MLFFSFPFLLCFYSFGLNTLINIAETHRISSLYPGCLKNSGVDFIIYVLSLFVIAILFAVSNAKSNIRSWVPRFVRRTKCNPYGIIRTTTTMNPPCSANQQFINGLIGKIAEYYFSDSLLRKTNILCSESILAFLLPLSVPPIIAFSCNACPAFS